MGGFSLAREMTDSFQLPVFSGELYGAMMGACITFAIPAALNTLSVEDLPYLLKGLVSGIVVIPAACFVGGVAMGMPIAEVACNLIPAALLAVILTAGLLLAPNGSMHVFTVFSRLVNFLMYIFLPAAVFERLTGFALIPGMAPIGPQLEVAGVIGITLAGAYPFVYFMMSILQRPLEKLGGLLGVNGATMGGLIACPANSLPMLAMVKDINPRGKVIATSFMVCGAFMFGGQFAYFSANMPAYISAMLLAKLTGGILAVLLSLLLTKT